MEKATTKVSLDKEQLIWTYLMAAINLYGVIMLDDFISIYNHYEEEKILESEEKLVIQYIRTKGDEIVSVKNKLIANGLFLLSDEKDYKEAKALLQIQGDKPRYLPSKEEFIKYEDDTYIEPMMFLLELERFIISNNLVTIKEPEDIRFDVIELHDQIVFGDDTSQYFEYITKRGYQFSGESQIKKFVDLMMKVMNTTRLYENKGFTPTEMLKYEELTLGRKTTN